MPPLRLFLLLLLSFLTACQGESPNQEKPSAQSDSSSTAQRQAAAEAALPAPQVQLDLASYEGKSVRQLLFDAQFDAFLQERMGDAYGDIVGNMGSGEAEILRRGDYLLLKGNVLQQEQPYESILMVGVDGKQLYAATAEVDGPVLRYFGGEQMPDFFIEWLQAHEKEVE